MKIIGCYVASLPCGCSVGFVNIMQGYEADSAKDVASFVKRGQIVTYFAPDDKDKANAAWQFKCERYPHEQWQREAHEPAQQSLV